MNGLRIIGITATLAATALGLAWVQEPTPRQRAVAAAAGLAEILKQLLGEELKHGPDAAVKACAESAQVVTEEFGKDQGLEIRRVSLKYRNRKDQPDEWESARLRQWETSGKPVEVFETVTENGRKYLRYLKPITVQGMCLACHGSQEQIPPDVRTALQERYPHDKATGYKSGDLRGAFSVTVAVE